MLSSNNIASSAPWRDSHSGKSSPDLLRFSSSYSSQNALDTPISEPATPEGHFFALPKLRTHSSTRANIKPHIRGRSRDERSSTSIDLSRSSLELEGLGIYTNLERDVRFSQNRSSATNHHRSISEIASSANGSRYSYVHPRRQLPTPVTPSLCESARDSIDEGYFSTTNGNILASESAAISVVDEDSQSIRGLETAKTFTETFHNTTRPIIQRAKTEVNSGKSSWKRLSKRQVSSDATASHAAAVHAARIAFEEKEASKGQKAEVLRNKTQERDNRRSLQSMIHQSPKQLEDILSPSQRRNNVDTVDGAELEAEAEGYEPVRRLSQSPLNNNNNWVRFMTWSRTRYYKAKRKVSLSTFTVN
ncbi:hypothetical protein BGW36DRAFT_304483 [Talaromyces proteolyticus]|uniref:Uncharacterized protein n=1 Tax=Talaromyces proteolyticus TaxID=1131652 RepID=A0AAD4PWI9_9EURO|nr:uncharacterized protein BGW36DRAFT_304483 [Talaromyces proteolyticus]KAH8692443.1 hypothetical protein BGW36DRAFT_304483 [Talaromyces proteolyticus]